jgi:two-component SAPR family response regulator
MKIIIVDDEMSALHVFLNGIICEKNVEYKFFNDDEEEISDYVLKNNVAAAFLDIGMPNIDGITLARNLIALSQKIKIVFTTGLALDKDSLPEEVKANTLGFVYKPYDNKVISNYLAVIANQTPVLTIKTFGSFECFINDDAVIFSSNKSKELFALLISYNGNCLYMNDAISYLWPDHDAERAKKLYRDAVWRLRKTLEQINFNCVTFGRAYLAIKKENIVCDYWEYLQSGKGDYRGEFMKNYDWSITQLAPLDDIEQ